MAPLTPSRSLVAGVFVLALLTACESGKIGEQSAQSDNPPEHSATTTESTAPPVNSPLVPPESMNPNAAPHRDQATKPAPNAASIKHAPVREPQVLANEAPKADTVAPSTAAAVATVPDTTRPVVNITAPAYGTQFNRNLVIVTGTVDDATAVVTVNDVRVITTGGAFTAPVALTEQGSNPLVATAVDRAGNRSTDSIMVTLDTLAPDIAISRPVDGWVTHVAMVTVEGQISDPGGDVTDARLNDAPLVLDRGGFSMGVPLVEGTNQIVISAGDVAGNYRSTIVTVYLDTTPPVPVVILPVESTERDEDEHDDDFEMRSAERGTLTGQVTFRGVPPAPKTFALDKFPNMAFCARADSDGRGNRVVQNVRIGKDNALKDVVIYIEDVQSGKPFEFTGTKVTADGCRFLVQGGASTFAGVVVKKKEIAIENMDADPSDPKAATGVLHNPHSYEVSGSNRSTIFNLPLAEKGHVVKKPVILRKKESIFELECDQHNYMKAFFVPVENPYYAIVKNDGTFEISAIPPGTYDVYAWHPTLGKQEAKVMIRANSQTKSDFSFSSK